MSPVVAGQDDMHASGGNAQWLHIFVVHETNGVHERASCIDDCLGAYLPSTQSSNQKRFGLKCNIQVPPGAMTTTLV